MVSAPVSTSSPADLQGVRQTCAQLAAGTVNAVSLVERSLERIQAVDGACGAWAHLADAADLLAQAAASDRRRAAGQALSVLDGLPVSVKDSQPVAGMPTAFGSLAALPVLAEQSSPMVASLQACGAIVLGKTTLPEFSWKATTESPRTGVTRNPRYPRFSPGGSSGGAAVSIAQAACGLATGTDAAGSVRIPAAFTGTAGFKPSDSVALATTAVEGFRRIGHWGLHAACAADLRVAWSALFGTEAASERLRWATVDDATRMSARARLFFDLSQVGLSGWIGPPCAVIRPDWEAADMAIHRLYLRGCHETVERIDPTRRHLMDRGLLDFAARGAQVGEDGLAEAIEVQVRLRAELDAMFESVDLLVLPTVTFEPPLLGQESPIQAGARDWLDWAHCTYLTNLTGHPSLSLPGELDGIPFGLQIVGRHGSDAALLALGEQIETELCLSFSA